MDTYKPKRYFAVFSDDDIVKDFVIDTKGNEHVVSLTGKQWKDYDWIFNRYEEIAKRLVDQSLFILSREPNCTLSIILGGSVDLFIEGYHEKKGKPIDPREGTRGSA